MRVPAIGERRILILILGSYLLLSVIYALTTPIFEASDELWHYPMVKHLADGNSLPVQVFDPSQAGPWKQEASQPPLYYYLGAGLTFWIDTSDINQVRWLNPHVDNGVITEDGNINLVVHDPQLQKWNGTQLAVRVVRLFSVAMGAVTVFLTYRIAKESAPGRSEIALGAAAVNAFLPMFLFISGAVNNDNLVITLSSLALLLMIVVGRRGYRNNREEMLQLFALGCVIGLGALTKITAIGLFPLAAFAIFIGRWANTVEQATWAKLSKALIESIFRLGLIILPVILIAGWWYYRNFILYGDWSGWNAFIAVLGQRAHPASIAQLWDEQWGFMISFWGLFGGLNVPMPYWVYHLLNAVLLVAVVGFIGYFLHVALDWLKTTQVQITNLETFFWNLLGFFERYLSLILCLFWSAAVIVGLIRWATITWSSQGRLVFSALSALCTLLVTGLVGWLPLRPARVVVGSLSLFLLVIASLAPFLWIGPAYQPSIKFTDVNMESTNITFEGQLKLRGFHISEDTLNPGQKLDVYLDWVSLRDMDKNWSVFVHLVDPILGVPIAQRDMYPGQGLLPTSLISSGARITNYYQLMIPESAIAPSDLELAVGLYDFETGERLKSEDGMDIETIDQISLEPASGGTPNPLYVNFENRVALRGFSLTPRRLSPGDSADLVLYWESLQQLNQDYTFFAQIIDQDTTRWASQDLNVETSDWHPGEINPIRMTLSLAQDTPVGVYPLIIGLYSRTAEGDFNRLQTLTAEGRLTDDYLSLSAVRIDDSQ